MSSPGGRTFHVAGVAAPDGAWNTADPRTADICAARARARPIPSPPPRPSPQVARRAAKPVASRADDHVVSLLTELLEVCGDGERGFAAAADHVEDQSIAYFLRALAVQRRQFAAQLEHQIRCFGGLAHDHGTIAGTLHRRWLTLLASLSKQGDRFVLHEAARGERVAMQTYDDVLDARLPTHLRRLLERQHAAVRAGHARLAALA